MSPTVTMERRQVAVRSEGHGDRWFPPCEEIDARARAAAARFLERRGYNVVATDWKCAAGVIDIVAEDGGFVVFIEVRVSSEARGDLPEERAPEASERMRLERIAAIYFANNDLVDVGFRFDVIAIRVISPDRAIFRHHINALGGCLGCPCSKSA